MVLRQRAAPGMTSVGAAIILFCAIQHTESLQVQTSSGNFPPFSFPCSHSQCNSNKKRYFNVTKTEVLPADASPCAVNISKSVSRNTEIFFNVECAKDSLQQKPIYNSSHDYGCKMQQPVTSITVTYECTLVFVNGSDVSTTSSLPPTIHHSYTTTEAQTLTNVSRAGDAALVEDSTSMAGFIAAAVCSAVPCGLAIVAVLLCHRRRLFCFAHQQQNRKNIPAAAACSKDGDQDFHDYAIVDYNLGPLHSEQLDQRYDSADLAMSNQVMDAYSYATGQQQRSLNLGFSAATHVSDCRDSPMASNELYCAS